MDTPYRHPRSSPRSDTLTEPGGRALHEMLRHVPRMNLPFDGDCTQGNGVSLPIVAINLAHRPDKWQTLCRRMSAVGLTKIVRVPAVDGARLPASQVAALLRSPADATDGGPVSHLTLIPPAVGCFLSHLAVWRWMVAAGLPRLLVLEDDARPAVSFGVERLRAVLDGMAPEMGLVLLGCSIMAGLADRPRSGAALARIYYFNGTHAYLIAPAACQTLLRLLMPLHAHLDHQISSVLVQRRHTFPAYYAAPTFFDPDWGLGSDLWTSQHQLSDESAADRELGEIFASSRAALLAEGRELLTEVNR